VSSESSPRSDASPVRKTARILVVDDEEDVLALVKTILSGARFAVLTARSGAEAIEIAARERPEMILLDVMMPEISGWEVCSMLKSSPETQSIPIVMLSVKNEIRDMITSMQAGADDHVTKPFSGRKLIATVQRLLEREDMALPPFLPSAEEHFRNKNLLYDSVTQLPTITIVVDALRDRLLGRREMGVLYVDVEKYSHIEDTYGWEVFDALILETSKTLKRLVGTLFSAEDVVAISLPAGSEFYVFTLLEPGDAPEARLARKARQTEDTLREALDDRFRERIHKPIGVFVGHAAILPTPQMRVERVVYRALREAIRVATTREQERAHELRQLFREILERRAIRTVFQPIFQLNTLEVQGYEALSRGPKGSAFESADLLFEYAIRNEAVWELERLCAESSSRHFEGMGSALLFVNIEADVLSSLLDRGSAILEPLLLKKDRIVLEVTERTAIRDIPRFRACIDELRDKGFRIAIDDAGSGFASLQAIAELRPNFLKVANTLVTGLADDPIKRDIVEMLLHVAHRIDAICVAEGIETERDLQECRRIGIPLGQGYFLGMPQEPQG
jgi:EAL domain-containing protein (putative c-di-GMP-specific phosphodiesterase class I)/DNA-binding response OmpR family regulator